MMATQGSDAAAGRPEAARPTGGPLVVLSGVDKHFGPLHVLRGIDLVIHSGEVVVVIGPSGSGRSTLCRTSNRLETIDGGTITVAGRPLPAEGRERARLRADAGMVFQSFNLVAHKTVLQNVMLGPVRARREPRRRDGGHRRQPLDVGRRVRHDAAAHSPPQFGILPPLGFWTAVVCLALYTSAFVAEAVRSGINSVAVGQAEAARAIGLTFGQTLGAVVLPQALRSVVPPLINVLIALTKNTSVAAGFAVVELVATGRRLGATNAADGTWVLVGVALCFLPITVPLGLLASRVERRVAFVR